MKFGEAVEAPHGTVQCLLPEWGEDWLDFDRDESEWSPAQLHAMRFRRKPQPVVVPRCREMARNERDRKGYNAHWAEEMEDFGECLVRELLDESDKPWDAAKWWSPSEIRRQLEIVRLKYLGSPTQGRAGR